MKSYDLITPDGTKDLLFGDCILKREVEEKIYNIFKSRGYSEVKTPGIEFFDVFNLNSEHFQQEKLYKFTDSEGRLLVLRPDSTIPISRMAASRLKNTALPLRLYYNQDIYVINRRMSGRSDEITQSGIELIGSYSRLADLEVIETAMDVLDKCGGGEFFLEIGDAGLFAEILNMLDADGSVKENITRLIESKNYPALSDLLNGLEDGRVNSMLKQLPRLFGGPEVFDKAANILSGEKAEKILDNLRSLYDDVSRLNKNGKISVDLGMANRTDYYTGIIIKGYISGYGNEILYGGRYDKLLSEFGLDIPAIGFAVDINAVCKILGKSRNNIKNSSDVIIHAEKGREVEAVQAAGAYRLKNITAELSLFDKLEDTREYAREKGITEIAVID